jgi:hypothetical protein
VQTCRRELLDRTLIWNQRHLLHTLREFEDFYGPAGQYTWTPRTPLRSLPEPIDPQQITRSHTRRRERLGGIFHEYEMPCDLHG